MPGTPYHWNDLAQGVRRGNLAALDTLLNQAGVTDDTHLTDSRETVLYVICKCKDDNIRRRMLERFAQQYPAGHPCWANQVWAAMHADVPTLHWFIDHGADVTVRDTAQPGGRPLLCHAVMRCTVHMDAMIHELLRHEPDVTRQDTLHLAWAAACKGPYPSAMALLLDLGVDPLTPLNASHPPGFPGTPGNTAVWHLLDHWKSFGSSVGRIEPALRVLDTRGGLDWATPNVLGQSLDEAMRIQRAPGTVGWSCMDVFESWQRQWVEEHLASELPIVPPSTTMKVRI